MTQIVAVIEPELRILATDRLLTYPDGRVHDTDATKMILFEGCLLIAYTGLAVLGNDDTGEWIARALADYRLASDALPGLTDKLNAVWPTLPRVTNDRLDIFALGVGHVDGQPCTYHAGVTNYPPQPGRFRWGVTRVPDGSRELRTFGQPLPDVRGKRLIRDLGHLDKRGIGLGARIRIVAQAIRDTAETNNYVGADILMCVTTATAMWKRTTMVVSGGSPRDAHISLFVPGTAPASPQWKTMWMVAGGGVAIGGGQRLGPGVKSVFEQ